MLRASPMCKHRLAPYLYVRATPPATARIPFIIQYLCSLLVCSRGAGGPRNGRKVFSRPACGEKFRAFLHYPVLSGFQLPCSVRRCPSVSMHRIPRWIAAAPGVPTQGSSSLTICKGFTRALSTVRPQWRCGPVTRPVAPTFPSTSPASRISPTFALISDRCP